MISKSLTNRGGEEELSGKRSLPNREVAGSIPSAGFFFLEDAVFPGQIYEYINLLLLKKQVHFLLLLTCSLKARLDSGKIFRGTEKFPSCACALFIILISDGKDWKEIKVENFQLFKFSGEIFKFEPIKCRETDKMVD